MPGELGDLLIKISADVGSATAGLEKLHKSIQKLSRSLDKLSKTTDALAGANKAIAGLARSVDKLSKASKSLEDANKSIATLARRIDKLSQASGSLENVNKALSRLTRQLNNVTPSASGAAAAMSRVSKSATSVVTSTAQTEGGISRLIGSLRSIGGSVGEIIRLGVSLGLVGAAAFTLVAAVRAVVNAVKDAVKAVANFHFRLEQSRVSWQVFLDDVAIGKKMLKDILGIARQVPIPVESLEEAARRLVAMGFAAREVIPWLIDISNAALALGLQKEGIERLVIALGQMKAKTKVASAEMRQLAEAGVPAWKILAREMGLTVREVMDLVAQGRVAADVMLTGFRRFVEERWGDLMARQADTFRGAMEIARNSLLQVGSTALEPLFDKLREAAIALRDWARSRDATVFAQNFSSALRLVIAYVGVFVGWVRWTTDRIRELTQAVPELKVVLYGLAGAIVAVNLASWNWIATLALVAAFLVLAYERSETFRQGIHNLAKEIESFFTRIGPMLPKLGAGLDTLDPTIADAERWSRAIVAMSGNVGESMEDIVRATRNTAGAFSQAAEDMKMGGESLGDIVNRIVQDAKEGLRGLGDFWGKVWSEIWASFQPPPEALEAPEDLARAMRAIAESGEDAALSFDEVAGAARNAGFSVNELTQAFIAQHPTVIALTNDVRFWEMQIASLNQAIRDQQNAIRAAQRQYQLMQDELRGLQRELAEAQRRLEEFSRPRLKGMGELEMKINAIQAQLKRIQLAELLGVPLEEIIKQYPLLTKGAEEYLATLPQSAEELEELLEQLELIQSLSFDEKLRLLQEAAEPAVKELTFEQAMRGVKETRARIDELTQAIEAQEQALELQDLRIREMQASLEGLNDALQAAQDNLKEARKKLDLVKEALSMAIGYLLEGRQRFIELGAKGREVTKQLDEDTQRLLENIGLMATDTSATSSEVLAEMVSNYERAMNEAISQVDRLKGALGSIPTYIETLHVTRHVDVYGEGAAPPPRIPGRQAGGPVMRGMPYIVGERGPELFVPRTSGSILSAESLRSLVQALVTAISSRPTYVVNAHYSYQSERSLRNDLRLLQMLYS